MTALANRLAHARVNALDLDGIAEAIGVPVEEWPGNCHSVSLAILRTGLLGKGRIARGMAEKVMSQHSWIVLGEDCYSRDAWIADPTIFGAWGEEPEIKILKNRITHVPHGSGSVWLFGRPRNAEDPATAIRLAGHEELSAAARYFLQMVGPLDQRGWMQLVSGPVEGWPAGDIIEAVIDDPQLGPAIPPIDVVGMLTDRNPGGLYR